MGYHMKITLLAIVKRGLLIVDNPYPIITKIFLFLNLSDKDPDIILNTLLVSSDDPSIAPRIALDAPKLLTINIGNTPKIISVEKSVKPLTKPKYKTLRIPVGLLSPRGLSLEFNSLPFYL